MGKIINEEYNVLTLGKELRKQGYRHLGVRLESDGFRINTLVGSIKFTTMEEFRETYSKLIREDLKDLDIAWSELEYEVSKQVNELIDQNQLGYLLSSYEATIERSTSMEEFYMELTKDFPIQIGNNTFILDKKELFSLTSWNMEYVYVLLSEYKKKLVYKEVYNFDWLTIYLEKLGLSREEVYWVDLPEEGNYYIANHFYAETKGIFGCN